MMSAISAFIIKLFVEVRCRTRRRCVWLLPQVKVKEGKREEVCVCVCACEKERAGGLGRKREGVELGGEKECVRKRDAPGGASWDSRDTVPCKMAGVITPTILHGTIPLGPLGCSSFRHGQTPEHRKWFCSPGIGPRRVVGGEGGEGRDAGKRVSRRGVQCEGIVQDESRAVTSTVTISWNKHSRAQAHGLLVGKDTP